MTYIRYEPNLGSPRWEYGTIIINLRYFYCKIGERPTKPDTIVAAKELEPDNEPCEVH